jgi:alpha-ketoglutarate-dependent taurine dioxygenase
MGETQQVVPTGFGRLLTSDHPMWRSRDWPALQDLVRDFGFVLVKDVDLDESACDALCFGLGEPVTYADDGFGYGYKVLVHLGRDGDEGRVIQGRGAMPLHSDGLLANRRVDIVLLYCADCRDAHGSEGATIVANQAQGLELIDSEVLDRLATTGLEYRIGERDYFTTLPDEWYRIPAVIERWGQKYLRLGLRYPPGTPAAWDVRVPNVSEAESSAILDHLEMALTRDDAICQHQWETGDLVLINNYTTLHGRNGFTSQRWLLNGQIVVPHWSSHD